jgi:hypothetical protein
MGACKGDKQCISQCPVALGIAYNESKFSPNGQSMDSIGRGLFQIGGGLAPPNKRGFSGPMCVKTPNKLNVTVNDCSAFHPIKNAIVAKGLSNNGKNWLPKGGAWWSCKGGNLKALSEPGTQYSLGKAKEVCMKAAESFGYKDITMNATSNCAIGPPKIAYTS